MPVNTEIEIERGLLELALRALQNSEVVDTDFGPAYETRVNDKLKAEIRIKKLLKESK